MQSIYDLESVRPYWEELDRIGVKPLTTSQEVDDAFVAKKGTTLLIINSVCGCAAGHARPGAGLALQHKIIPDNLYTVFAGVDLDATIKAREYIGGYEPSSPSIALFKNGKQVLMIERKQIEAMDAEGLCSRLIRAFDKYCTAPGPSVSKEIFENNFTSPRCSSTLKSGNAN